MKESLIKDIQEFVSKYQENDEVVTGWGEPIVGFASADDKLFEELKNVVVETHAVPRDLLQSAQTVISFFLPFAKSVASTNIKERLSSPEWALSYVETNKLIQQLGLYMTEILAELDEKVVTIPATHNWIEETLISNWSHRHVAYIAGVGRFGLNNMLITDKGCSGRIGSLIISASIEPDKRPEQEACLFKFDGSCKKCVTRCVNEALIEESFDRFKCYDQLLENVEEHKNIGYSDVCGKCLAAVPCTHTNPVKLKIKAQKKKKTHK